ncbi:MAG: hypothetical protein JW741_19820 [Sedimentisphaerales bacterium]|nr:hypothetical protein [Sedimentisphaerales bacterium]
MWRAFAQSGLLLVLTLAPLGASAAPARWWPRQRSPKAVVRVPGWGPKAESPGPLLVTGSLGATHMLAQSLAGLAAQAVNEGRSDEMVWIETDNPSYRLWYAGLIERLELEERGAFDPWQLVDRYRKTGLIAGYVLYRYDRSAGRVNQWRAEMDMSANVATTVAGLRRAVLVEEQLEATAQQHGLTKLFDARAMTPAECFETFKPQLNRTTMLTQDPKVPHNRAMAIAHKCAVAYGTQAPVGEIMASLEPPAPIMGWNCGGEDEHTALPSRFGHIQTASNWALNLPILSAGTDAYEGAKIKTLDPGDIDWDDERHAVSFVLSDGDNVQWMLGNFFTNPAYWSSSYSGAVPFGWTSCPAHLSQVCPEALDYLARTQPAHASIIEYGGGYHYPDLFGASRDDPKLLEKYARRVSEHMQRTGARIFGFICMDVDSPAARHAYEVYAAHIEGLVGMIAVQYYPYDGGDGEVFWVRNARGVEIPVATCKFSLWRDAHWPRGGDPAKIARLINESAARAQARNERLHCWTVVHAWSRFERESDPTESQAGPAPAAWCAQRLDKNVAVVSPEELLWRMRMKHDPEATKAIINRHKD